MPKINTTFYPCPDCGNLVFKKREFVAFTAEPPTSPHPEIGMVYETQIAYECTRCGKEVKREIVNG